MKYGYTIFLTTTISHVFVVGVIFPAVFLVYSCSSMQAEEEKRKEEKKERKTNKI